MVITRVITRRVNNSRILTASVVTASMQRPHATMRALFSKPYAAAPRRTKLLILTTAMQPLQRVRVAYLYR